MEVYKRKEEQVTMKKRLTKAREKKLAGVCSGIAEYLDLDPTLIRIAWALIVLCFGTGLLVYIVAALIMPESNDTYWD